MKSKHLHSKASHDYDVILSAVLIDGIVSIPERKLCEAFAKRHQITHEEHANALLKYGWSERDWEKGFHVDKQSELVDISRRLGGELGQAAQS